MSSCIPAGTDHTYALPAVDKSSGFVLVIICCSGALTDVFVAVFVVVQAVYGLQREGIVVPDDIHHQLVAHFHDASPETSAV